MVRSARYNSLLAHIRNFHDNNWLVSHRLRFVSQFGGRNRPDAGRLGMRASGGKPQPRWHEGVELVRQVKEIRSTNLNGSSRSIGSRIRDAQSYLMSFFNPAD